MDFSKYFAYMTSLEEALEKEKIEIKSFNEEQSKNLDLFLKMEEKILREKSIYLKKTEDTRYLMSQWVHNLKTPVSVIDLILQETKTKNLDEIEAERVIREIQEENSLIHQGLEQILSLLRLDEFAQDYEPELVDLKKSLEEIINTTKNRFIYSKTFPKIEADLNSYPVLTDSKWNRIMVEQIISNAIKYSMEQNTTKFITFTFEKGPEYVTLHIDDDGIGIPKYDLERLFDPFFTGENGRKNRNSTGIGLYIVKQICDKLGHKIKINSQVGKGTRVSLTYLSKL